jgi:alkylation response protein AidB-like acyl-CoA dehydrogenase
MTTDQPLQTVTDALDELLSKYPPTTTPAEEFLGARFDAGLAWVHFQPGFGGLGVPAGLQPVVTERLEAAGAPAPDYENYVGTHQGAAAIHHYASDELKHRWLRPSFTGQEMWCQLFSEPGAGSDLAGMATMALPAGGGPDGDGWVVNGQKVWTSFAHKARWAILLARTDPNVVKHRGLTFFVVDMHDPGVEVRPLVTMDGAHHFNEVFLTDVRVPDTYRFGAVGEGWKVSQFLLASEREGITEHESLMPWLMQAWRDHGPLHGQDAVYRDRVARAYTELEMSRLLTARAKAAQGTGGPDAFAPVLKTIRNRVDQDVADLVMDLHGADGMLGGDYAWQRDGKTEPDEQMRFLRTRAYTIGGGTAQIMRNIIAERILGLPGEPRVDKDIPWSQVPRS